MTARFGWCLTADHHKCWVTNGDLTCSCPCHNEGEK